MLAVVAAAWVLPGARRRRVGSALAASVLLMVGNVARLAAIGWFGTTIKTSALFAIIAVTLFFAVLLLLAATSYRWFEKPAMDAIRDVWKRRRDPQPVQTPTPASTQHGQSAPAP